MTQIDGSWTIDTTSPMGKQTAVLDIATQGTTATGKIIGPDGSVLPIEEANVEGSTVTFKAHMTSPVSMSMKFTLTFNGDTVSGKVKAGLFPPSKATGHRVQAT